MLKSRCLLVTLIPLVAAACSGELGDFGDDWQGNAAERRAALVNGSSYSGHPAVGKLTGGGALCTATLVGDRTVVTAAHCLKSSSQSFVVGGRSYSVTTKFGHPGYDPNADKIRDDVAIVRLSTRPSVTPASLGTRAPYSGLSTTLIGFGRTAADASDSGVKRVGYRTISSVSTTEIAFKGSSGSTPNLCFGDSGGPTFARLGGQEVQIGIHSYILGPKGESVCGVEGRDMRIDRYLSWFKSKTSDIYTDGAGPDRQKPTVKIIQPGSGVLQTNSVFLRASASDNIGVTKLELHVNGQLVKTLTRAPYDFQVTLPQTGQSSLEVIARDAAGNASNASVVVDVAPPPDAEAPKVAIISPRTNSTLAAGPTVVKSLVSDNRGVRDVVLTINGQVAGTLTQPPYDFPVNLPSGALQIAVHARDLSGNTAKTAINVFVPGAGQQPSQPSQPGQPSQPSQPGQPSVPGQPSQPGPNGVGGQLAGGCAVAGSGHGGGLMIALLLPLLGIVLSRRRRRRR